MKRTNEAMYVTQINDKDKIGLHARPVAKIIAATTKYRDTTKVTLYKLNDNVDINQPLKLSGDEPKANCLSILSVIGLGVKNECKIAFIAEGDKCNEVIDNIKVVLKQENLI